MGVNELLKIGAKIKQHRISKGFNQKAMAELLNIPRSTYSNYENDNREPDAYTLKKIARTLELPLYKFLGITPQTTEAVISDRRQRYYSVNQFASLLNIPKDELLDYESEVKKIPIVIIIKCAIILNTLPTYLVWEKEHSENFNFEHVAQNEIIIISSENFSDARSLESLKGIISKEDYDELLIYVEQHEEGFLDTELRTHENLKLLLELYQELTSIEEINEDVLVKIIQSKELSDYLEYLNYKFSKSKNK